VTSRSRDVNKQGGGVNNLNPFSLDEVKQRKNMVNNFNHFIILV